MSGILLDENLPLVIAVQLRRHEPRISTLAVGEPGAPSKGTLDPELLVWLETHDCWLITHNRTSMPRHLQAHLSAGHHVPGIFVAPFPLNIGALIAELILIWEISLAGEFTDQIIFLPISE